MRLLVTIAVLAWLSLGAPDARADEQGRVVDAIASSTDGGEDLAGVARLFDGDDATAWCAREKVKVRVTLRLDKVTRLTTLHLTLGNPSQWKQTPRVKQVVVSVVEGDNLLKKVRHKWPDGDAREGTVNLGVSGDAVIIEFDQVYAGSSPRGLCVAGMRLRGGFEGSERQLDTAPLYADAAGQARVAAAVPGVYLVTVPLGEGEARHAMKLDERGKLEYRDDAAGLQVHGTWKLVAASSGRGLELIVEIRKVKLGKKKLKVPPALARGAQPWRFAPAADGEPARFLPFFALSIDEAGVLVAREPLSVVAR